MRAHRPLLNGLAALGIAFCSFLPPADGIARSEQDRPGPMASSATALGAGIARMRSEVEAGRIQLAQLASDPAALAAFQNRLTRLDEELRQMTGRLERLEFEQRQTEQRLDRLVATMDERLRAIESRAAGAVPEDAAAAASDDRSGEAAPAEDTAPATGATSRSAPDIEPDAAARDGFVLGSIPRDALLGIDRPDADTGDAGSSGTVPSAALQGSAKARYDAALELLQDNNWEAAEIAFERFLQDFPDDPQAASAGFWIGETHFFREDFGTAAAVYARNYRTWGPDAPRAPDNLLKLGMSLAALGDGERACRTFAELEQRYPGMTASLKQAVARERSANNCQ